MPSKETVLPAGGDKVRIVCLVENTPGREACVPAHGLSLYVETEKRRLLLDTGPSGLLVENARALGVDLTRVDAVVLSHGHYDHAGGVAAFAALNPNAPLYARQGAAGDFWSASGGTPHPIGMDPAVTALPQWRWLDREGWIDENLFLFGGVTQRQFWPPGNNKLFRKTAEGLIPDDFSHEQHLVIREKGKSVLLSGCAHNGIVNILHRCREVYGAVPDAVISGFHLMKKSGQHTPEEIEGIRATARALLAWPCVFYTCHCTGLPAFAVMKEIMGDRLRYLPCGDTLEI